MRTETVYYFTDYDVINDQVVRSQRPATRSAIEALGTRFKLIEESSMEVSVTNVDENGFLMENHSPPTTAR